MSRERRAKDEVQRRDCIGTEITIISSVPAKKVHFHPYFIAACTIATSQNTDSVVTKCKLSSKSIS